MNVPNELTAKVLGDILSKGMKICDVDLSDRVRCEAINALDEIKLVMHCAEANEKVKLNTIKKIMDKYNIGYEE